MVTETEVSVSESPVFSVTAGESTALMVNAPLVLAVQNEMSVSVSGDVPAQLSQAGWLLAVTEPAAGPAHVTLSRVATDDTFAVPLAPGGPVCS